jgi:hypothetical protein
VSLVRIVYFNEDVIQNLFDGVPIFRIGSEHSPEQIDSRGGEPLVDAELALDDVALDVEGRGRAERGLAVQQLVQQDAERPHVDLLVLVVAADHLGRHVLVRAAKRDPVVRLGPGSARELGELAAPAEVGHLGHEVRVEQDVLRLEVAVQEALAVDVLQRQGHLGHDLARVALRKPLVPLQKLVQVPVRSVLQQHVQLLVRLDQVVELYYVRMVQQRVASYLFPHVFVLFR